MLAAAHQTHQTIHMVAGTLPPHRVRTAMIRSPNFNHLKRVSIPHIQYYYPRGLNTRGILYTLIEQIDTSQNRERPPPYIHTDSQPTPHHTIITIIITCTTNHRHTTTTLSQYLMDTLSNILHCSHLYTGRLCACIHYYFCVLCRVQFLGSTFFKLHPFTVSLHLFPF